MNPKNLKPCSSFEQPFLVNDSHNQGDMVDSSSNSRDRLYQAFFEQAIDAMFIVDDDGRYLEANLATCNLLGVSKEEILGHSLAEFLDPAVDFVTGWQKFQQQGQAQGEIQLLRSDGVTRDVEYTATANFLPKCHLAVLRDITHRKQTEFAMQQTLEREQQAIHRERLIGAISQNIRQSLNLNYILTTAVEEMQQLLQVERVVIYRFNADWQGRVVAEALEEETFSIAGQIIDDPCFQESKLNLYRQGHIHIVDDVDTTDLSPCYREMLMAFQVRALLAIPIMVGQDLWGLLIVHQCTSPRQWNQINWHSLQQLSTQLAIGIHQAELYRRTQQQAQKEQMLNWVIQAVRNSLDLNTIFSTATSEIGKLLKADRAEIVQYLPSQSLWLNVASYRRTPDLPDSVGQKIPDQDNPFATKLKQLEVVYINDYVAEMDSTNHLVPHQCPGFWLLIPLQVSVSVWGSLSINHLDHTWVWQDWEVQLVRAIADQLAIAIQQSELYQQVQQLNTNLEAQVQERTTQLQQALRFEGLLKRITDKVRDSLDESQILQTAVLELVNGMEVDCCNAGLYNLEDNTVTISYEQIRTENLASLKSRVLPLNAHIPSIHQQILQRQYVQFCLLPQSQTLLCNANGQFTILSCPLMDDRDVLGDLWVFKSADAWFDDLDIRLVQQVANQCAIAIRQSRLYQEAQAQVAELGRLNQLKDDFLSTVSHELRTPLSNIRMATQMLDISLQQLNLAEVTSGLERYLQILKEECQRETALINNLLELTRLDAATEPLFLTPIHLQILIPHIAEPFADRLLNQRQRLVIDIPSALPRLTTDLSYLERILSELLLNACKYTPTGETITVSAIQNPRSAKATEQSIIPLPPNPRHPSLQISITNSGAEIPEPERDRIFDKFYRIPNNDPWKHGGTGLGLALVKKLTERLGAKISVDSSAGQTIFTLQFPLETKGKGLAGR